MNPVLIRIGNLQIYAFGVAIAAGILLVLWLMARQSRRTGFPLPDQVSDLIFVILFSGFLGARILFVAQHWDYFSGQWTSVLAFWEGGLTFYGGFLGAVAGLAVFVKIKKLPFWETLDFLAPYVALVHAFGRLGCFLNGCCGGKISEVPWAVKFPRDAHAVHPAQLYELFFNLGVFLLLRWRYGRRRFSGEIVLLYFGLYGLGRFLIEFVRSGNPFWGPLTVNQWISLMILTVAAVSYRVRAAREAGNG